MACNHFYRVLRSADVLLPEALGAWVETRWTGPHAEVCDECRNHRDRFARLNGLLRDGLLGDPAGQPVRRVAARHAAEAAPLAWPGWAIVGTALGCVVLLLSSAALRDGGWTDDAPSPFTAGAGAHWGASQVQYLENPAAPAAAGIGSFYYGARRDPRPRPAPIRREPAHENSDSFMDHGSSSVLLP